MYSVSANHTLHCIDVVMSEQILCIGAQAGVRNQDTWA